jgi:hypothetical protein
LWWFAWLLSIDENTFMLCRLAVSGAQNYLLIKNYGDPQCFIYKINNGGVCEKGVCEKGVCEKWCVCVKGVCENPACKTIRQKYGLLKNYLGGDVTAI